MVWPHPRDVILYARSSYYYDNMFIICLFLIFFLILKPVLVFNLEKLRDPKLPEKSHNVGLISSIGPVPLKNYKATKPVFNVGPSSARQQSAIQMAFRWQADDGQLLVVFGYPLPSSTKKKKRKTKKKQLAPSDKTFWIRACAGLH